MFKKKITLILVILAIGLTACGTQTAVSDTAQSASAAAPANESPSAASADEAETVTVSTSESAPVSQGALTYPIVDTDQSKCYGATNEIGCPLESQSFYGQDAQYTGNQLSYTDNGDGTITDNVTGLMWQQDPGEKMTYQQAAAGADSFTLAGYDDWRLPTIKELYSLIQFDGTDVSRCADAGTCTAIPFIDTDYFNFEYGDTAVERMIDSQWATSSIYTGTVFGNQQAMFGVNFADGRIKGYPTGSAGPGGQAKTYFVIYVRGNTAYGENSFVDNGNGTITDNASGLTWTQNDSQTGLNWEDSLNYCESLETGGISDWRLPNAKELQSLVDYSRSPDATNSAAIDPIFNISTITNEAGQLDYPAFWSSTTHVTSDGNVGTANYVTFGRAMGYMNGQWMDVHGAGAQRSEEKSGDPSSISSTGRGPQGDAVRIYNYVRCVTDSSTTNNASRDASSTTVGTETQSPSGQPADEQNPASEQGRPEIDFAAAAAQLGVTEDALRAALGAPPPDFDAAAAQLGVTVDELIAALGIPAGGPQGGQGTPPSGGQPPAGAPQG